MTLTKWGGWACVVIAVGHSILGLTMSGEHVPGWFAGDLWSSLGTTGMWQSKVAYWAVPAGFPLPLILVGLMVVGRAREGRAAPAFVGWALLGWAAFGSYVGFPTGFLFVIVPAVLLIIGRRGRKPDEGLT